MENLAIINLTTKLSSNLINEYFELPSNANVGESFEASGCTFVIVTKEQAQSFERTVKRQGFDNYIKAYYDHLMGCLIVSFKDILIGIETDGYAHS